MSADPHVALSQTITTEENIAAREVKKDVLPSVLAAAVPLGLLLLVTVVAILICCYHRRKSRQPEKESQDKTDTFVIYASQLSASSTTPLEEANILDHIVAMEESTLKTEAVTPSNEIPAFGSTHTNTSVGNPCKLVPVTHTGYVTEFSSTLDEFEETSILDHIKAMSEMSSGPLTATQDTSSTDYQNTDESVKPDDHNHMSLAPHVPLNNTYMYTRL